MALYSPPGVGNGGSCRGGGYNVDGGTGSGGRGDFRRGRGHARADRRNRIKHNDKPKEGPPSPRQVIVRTMIIFHVL